MRRTLNVLLAIVMAVSCIAGNAMYVKAETEEEKTVIALDPGHDDRHGGASAGGLNEQDLTLKIAYYCKEELEKYDNIEVYMTRTDAACPYPDTTSSARCIDQRVLAAANAGASLYVSLHLNAEEWGTSANGVEVIYPNSSWKSGLGSTGMRLAQYIQSELTSLGLYDRGIYYKNTTIGETYPDGSVSDYYTAQIAGKENGIPAVIVENAFITNATDRSSFLQTEEGLKKLGVANANAIMKTLGNHVGWEYWNNHWYYYANGIMQTGWHVIDGSWYYFNAEGQMQTDWEYVNGLWYYFNTEGQMQTGWLLKGNHWYYLNSGGAMQTGWLYLNGTWYYMDEGGAMQTDWQLVNGTWYYMDASGAMVTGWKLLGNTWYYMDGSGAMQTGWEFLGGTWYYMDAGGAMQTGWELVDGTWYYMDASGAMATGWKLLGNTWYYMDGSGAMVTGTQMINGKIYHFDGDGAWIR